MLLASFLDKTMVAPGIVLGWIGLIFIVSVAGGGRRRPLGITMVAGVFALLALMALTDWLVDDAF